MDIELNSAFVRVTRIFFSWWRFFIIGVKRVWQSEIYSGRHLVKAHKYDGMTLTEDMYIRQFKYKPSEGEKKKLRGVNHWKR